MIMWIAVIIIVILMLLDKDESKKIKENENEIIAYNTTNGRPILRKHVNILGYDIRTGQPEYEYKKPIIGYHPETGDPIFEGEEIPEVKLPKQPMTDEERTRLSNSILIVTGAVLVVLASIIFLVTGWETMNGILKTLILFGIQMIFCLFGYISNKKLDIPKIGKMFNCLTLAFVPVVLMSLSFFELVGDYFSINGDGAVYYTGIALLITDAVYKIYGKAYKDLFAKRSSLIVEAIAVVFLVSEIEVVAIEVLAMVIHTIIIYLLLQGGYLDKEAYKGLNDFYSIMLIILAALYSGDSIMSFTNLILLAIGFFIRCLDVQEDSQKKPLLICFFIAYLLSIRIIDEVEISNYFLYLLSLIPILGLTKVVNTEKMKKNIVSVVGILTIVISVFAAFNPEQTIYYLLTYIIGFIVSVLVYFLTNKGFYKLCSYLSFAAIFFTICYITEIKGVYEYIFLVMAILVYALEVVFDKLKDKTSSMFIIGSLCAETIVLKDGYYMLIPLLLLVAYLLLEKKTDDLIIPMVFSFFLFRLDNDGLLITIFGILTIVYSLLSIYKEKFNKYTMFSVLTMVILCIHLELDAYILWGLLLIWGILHYVLKQEGKEIYQSTVIFSIFGIYAKSLIDLDSNLYSTVALGIILVSVSMSKGVFKKANSVLMGVIECIIIGLLTIIGSIAIQDPLDGVIYLGILLILSIFAYTKNWKYYLYSSIVGLLFGIFMLTIEYWKEIPWYVYILFIGLALIVFAMYDEKRKQNKKLKEQIAMNVYQNVPVNNMVQETVPQIEEPTVIDSVQPIEDVSKKEGVQLLELPTIETVEDTSTEELTVELPLKKAEDQQAKKTKNKKNNSQQHNQKKKN